MVYRANPFLERMSERTASDQEFVRQFSPRVLDQLAESALDAGIHIFRSAPGGGKTTLLRAFTPSVLRAFWNSGGRRPNDLSESFQKLVARGVLDEERGPTLLGVILSCSSGYADLPPSTQMAQEGLFRALVDCRVVLRTLRSLAALVGLADAEQLSTIDLKYEGLPELSGIPRCLNAHELHAWAEMQEQSVYADLDSFAGRKVETSPAHARFESLLWLQYVTFEIDGQVVASRRVLMLDDLHALRRRQRSLLIDEFTLARPKLVIWLAERRSALGDTLLSEGAREGRDLIVHSLEEMWAGPKGAHQFSSFAQNVLDRRMRMQDSIEVGSFAQCLRDDSLAHELQKKIKVGVDEFRREMKQHENSLRYSEWMRRAKQLAGEESRESLVDLYVTKILMARDASKRQMSLDLALTGAEREELESSQVRGAAEIFLHREFGLPYYFGIDRLCVMSTTNIEELLALAAALYVGIQAKHVLRDSNPVLSPLEQEKILKEAAARRWEFIPKGHFEGLRSQKLLGAIGVFCRDRTFLPNAPYAPGVTGIRLSKTELALLDSEDGPFAARRATLRRVLAECAAENLLVPRPSIESSSREGGTVFYLNRTLCAIFDLPLQMGGWQEVSSVSMIEWMERGAVSGRERQRGLA